MPVRTKEDIKGSVRDWSAKLGVPVKTITIRPMSRKWASWSTNGNLTLSDELLAFDAEVGDYVIVHELLHDKAPNHGKLWKSLMRAYLGDFEHVEQELRQIANKGS